MASPSDRTDESKFWDESYPIALIGISTALVGDSETRGSFFPLFLTMFATTVDKLFLGMSALVGTTAAGGYISEYPLSSSSLT